MSTCRVLRSVHRGGDLLLVGQTLRHARRDAPPLRGHHDDPYSWRGLAGGVDVRRRVTRAAGSAAESDSPLVAPRRSARPRRRRQPTTSSPACRPSRSEVRRRSAASPTALTRLPQPVPEAAHRLDDAAVRACGAGSARRCPPRPRPRHASKTLSTSSRRVKTRRGLRASTVEQRGLALGQGHLVAGPGQHRTSSTRSSSPPGTAQHVGVVTRTPQQGPEPGQQLVEVERLAEVVLGPGVQPVDPVARAGPAPTAPASGRSAPRARSRAEQVETFDGRQSHGRGASGRSSPVRPRWSARWPSRASSTAYPSPVSRSVSIAASSGSSSTTSSRVARSITPA